jgi:hypothetical protein
MLRSHRPAQTSRCSLRAGRTHLRKFVSLGKARRTHRQTHRPTHQPWFQHQTTDAFIAHWIHHRRSELQNEALPKDLEVSDRSRERAPPGSYANVLGQVSYSIRFVRSHSILFDERLFRLGHLASTRGVELSLRPSPITSTNSSKGPLVRLPSVSLCSARR